MRRTERGELSRPAPCLALAAGLLLALVMSAVASGAESMALTIDEAVELAREHSDALAASRAEADAAEARARQARAGFFPMISGSASYTKLDEAPYMDASQFGEIFAPLMVPFQYLVDQGYLDPETLSGLQVAGGSDKIYLGDDDVYSIGLSVTQPLFTGGAVISSYGAARHGATAGALNVRRAEDRLVFDVTEAYLGLVQARAALDVMRDAREQMASHLADVEALYEEGMLIESDLMLARVRMSQVELDLSKAEHIVRLANSALAFVIGVDIETEIEPLENLSPSVSDSAELTDLTDVAMTRRPDLQAMSELVGAADNAVTIARSGYMPQLVLVGNYNWDRPNREYEPEFYEHWSATLALTMNIFDWGLTGNRVREARAGLMQAERGRDMMEDAVRLEVKQSYLALDEAEDALDIAEGGARQARESLRVAREAFRNGVATNSNVLDAQTAQTTAEMNRIAALAGLMIAEARLELATGTAK